MLTNNQYVQQIIDAAKQYGVDPNLALGVAHQESGINPNVQDSPTGAMGIMQLEPSTAAGLGVDPRNVSQNIIGGVRYLRQMQDQFNDPKLMLAAYNAGPARVSHWLANGGTLPAETLNYVRSITGSPITAPTMNSQPSGKTPMANAMQVAQNGAPPALSAPQQQPVLFGGQPSRTPLGMAGGLLRMLGVGADDDIGRHLQNAGAGLIAVGNPQGAAALQNAANMPLFRSRFSVGRDEYGRNFLVNNHTGQVTFPGSGGGGVPGAGGVAQAAGGGAAPTDAATAYATQTPAGIKALGDAQIAQSVKDKAKIMAGAEAAYKLKTLLKEQMELAQDPDVIQGAFPDAREALAGATSYITNKRYGYNTASKTDLFNKNNGVIMGLSKSLLGSNARLAGPELQYLATATPGNDKQSDTNLSIYKDMANLADRSIYAADLAGKTPVLSNDFYNTLNSHFAKAPGYANYMGDNPGGKFTPKGDVDPNSFWKK